MGFFDRVGSGSAVPMEQKVTNVKLTPEGVHKLQSMQASNFNNEFNVLASVKKLEPCSPEEVARDLNLPENKVRYTLRSLQERKLIMVL